MAEITWSEQRYRASLQCDLWSWRLQREAEARSVASSPPDWNRDAILEAMAGWLGSDTPQVSRAKLPEAGGLPDPAASPDPGTSGPGVAPSAGDCAPGESPLVTLRDPNVATWVGVRLAVASHVADFDAIRRVSAADAEVLRVHVYCLLGGRSAGEADWDRAAYRYWFLRERLAVEVAALSFVGMDPRFVAGSERPFFKLREVADQVAPLALEVGEQLAAAERVVTGPEPQVELGIQCRRPERCPFIGRCERGASRDSVFWLPRLSAAQSHAFAERGIRKIQEIPARELTGSLQRRAQLAVGRAELVIEPGLERELLELRPPFGYLDFEYLMPALPSLAGMRPYEAIPCQWSWHVEDERGGVSHRDFLCEDPSADPRAAFLESLLARAADTRGPVFVYSSAESDILLALSRAQPSAVEGIEALRARLVDLQAILLRFVYHPDFRGSFGLKSVVAALGLGVDYDDLDQVAEGAGAARALHALSQAGPSGASSVDLRRALLDYCRRDTQALIELHRFLRKCVER